MPPSSQSSFIPKKSIKRIERVRSSHRVNILTYISYSVFFGVILVAVATFFYLQFLQNKLDQTLVELADKREAFSGGNIEAVKEMERRLRMAEYFFGQHISSYRIFNELEKLAVRDITFSGFTFDRITDTTVQVSITGQSFKFDSVAFQTDLFADSDLFAKSQLAEITKEAQVLVEGDTDDDTATLPVNFIAKMSFDLAELAYDSSIYTIVPPQPIMTAPTSNEVTSSSTAETVVADDGVEPTTTP